MSTLTTHSQQVSHHNLHYLLWAPTTTTTGCLGLPQQLLTTGSQQGTQVYPQQVHNNSWPPQHIVDLLWRVLRYVYHNKLWVGKTCCESRNDFNTHNMLWSVVRGCCELTWAPCCDPNTTCCEGVVSVDISLPLLETLKKWMDPSSQNLCMKFRKGSDT